MSHNFNQMDEINKFIDSHDLPSSNNENLRYNFEAAIVYRSSQGSNEEFYYNISVLIIKENNEYTVNIFELPSHIFSKYDSKWQDFKFGNHKDLKITDKSKSYQVQIII